VAGGCVGGSAVVGAGGALDGVGGEGAAGCGVASPADWPAHAASTKVAGIARQARRRRDALL
jgi:hypothetical protein